MDKQISRKYACNISTKDWINIIEKMYYYVALKHVRTKKQYFQIWFRLRGDICMEKIKNLLCVNKGMCHEIFDLQFFS